MAIEVPRWMSLEERIRSGLYGTMDNLIRGSGMERFKHDLLEDFGLLDHPKADKFFELCWSDGHSGGYNEVYGVALEWSELLT